MSAGRSTGVPRRRAAARFLQLCQFDRGRLDLEGHEAPADAGNDIRDARRPIHPAVFLPREAARRFLEQPQDRGHDVAFGHERPPVSFFRCKRLPESLPVYRLKIAGHLRLIFGFHHFQRVDDEICAGVDAVAFHAEIAPVLLNNARLAVRRIDVPRPGDGLLQGFFSVGCAVRMVHLVPFLPEQRRLAEQPVHLLPVAAHPEGRRAVEREVGLRLDGEFILPVAFPQDSKVLGVLRRPRLFQHLFVGEHDAPGRLFFALRFLAM